MDQVRALAASTQTQEMGEPSTPHESQIHESNSELTTDMEEPEFKPDRISEDLRYPLAQYMQVSCTRIFMALNIGDNTRARRKTRYMKLADYAQKSGLNLGYEQAFNLMKNMKQKLKRSYVNWNYLVLEMMIKILTD